MPPDGLRVAPALQEGAHEGDGDLVDAADVQVLHAGRLGQANHPRRERRHVLHLAAGRLVQVTVELDRVWQQTQ